MTPALRELADADVAPAAALLGRSMRENPLFVVAFRRDERALARFLSLPLRAAREKGRVVGAWEGARLVGLSAGVPAGRCASRFLDRLRLTGELLFRQPFRTLRAYADWTQAWARHHPRTPHAHLGPVAVEADARGRGVGGALVDDYCRGCDARGEDAYLETDTAGNVAFYRKRGFEVVGEEIVIGVPNWFMARKARK